MDVFKVPTCCTCHVLGYYVPGTKKNLPQSPAGPAMRRRDHLGPRFMGPPRARRISPHMGLHPRKHMHPMMVMLPGPAMPMSPALNQMSVLPSALSSAAVPTASANTTISAPTAASNSEDEVLRSLLLQYASLREKITKLKDCKLKKTYLHKLYNYLSENRTLNIYFLPF